MHTHFDFWKCIEYHWSGVEAGGNRLPRGAPAEGIKVVAAPLRPDIVSVGLTSTTSLYSYMRARPSTEFAGGGRPTLK